jgi:hypothetical protein
MAHFHPRTVRFGFLGVLAAAFVAASSLASEASTITFDFATNAAPNSKGTDGNSRVFTSGGVTVTATAWSWNGSHFSNGALGWWTAGLGVCDDNEFNGCGSPEHQIDNQGGLTDFVLFQFSAPAGVSVDPASVSIKTYSTGNQPDDLDVSYWVGNFGLSNGALLPSGQVNNDCSGACSVESRVVTLTSGYVGSLLFGARLGPGADNNFDYFKIESLTVDTATRVTTTATAVPEPASLMLTGAGLIVVASRLRRRRGAATAPRA